MKVTDYERVNSVQDSDVLLIDGNRGTKTILVNDLHCGHIILDEDGTAYPQRSKLQFEGCEITDDAVNGVTVVKCEGGGTVIVEVPTVTNTELIYDGTAKSPTITRDTDHTTIAGTTEATERGEYTLTISLKDPKAVWSDLTNSPKTYTWGIYNTVAIDVYSAANDTVYYLDNGSPVTVCTTDATGHGTVSKSSLPAGTYTLYSTVAKDPENLSNDYSKSVTVAFDTDEIYLMPEHVIYWWGNKCAWMFGGEIVDCKTNGWTTSYSYSTNWVLNNVTFNTNYVVGLSTANNQLSGVAKPNKIDLTDFTACKGIFYTDGSAGYVFNCSTKDMNTVVNTLITVYPPKNEMVFKTSNIASITGEYYVYAQLGAQTIHTNMYALWLE